MILPCSMIQASLFQSPINWLLQIQITSVTPVTACTKYVVWQLLCDDIQSTVLMNWVECKKQKNSRMLIVKCHMIYAFYFLKITSNWSSWHEIHSCNCDLKLIILCSRHLSVSLISSLVCYVRM